MYMFEELKLELFSAPGESPRRRLPPFPSAIRRGCLARNARMTEAATDEDFHDLLGRRVTINGLKSKPELNGKRGLVMSFDHAVGRAGVKIAGSGQMLSIKPSNLKLDDVNAQAQAAPEQGLADLSVDESVPAAPAAAASSPPPPPPSAQEGFTELALNNRAAELKVLIESKADINQKDRAGNTALICAAFGGHTECVELLLGAKAWLDATTPRAGFTALMAARRLASSNGLQSRYAECVSLLEEATKMADIRIEPFGPTMAPLSAVTDHASTTAAAAGVAAPNVPAATPAPEGTRLAIVSTMKRPPNLLTWLRYHREHCGVGRFYLRLEASPELKGPLGEPPWDEAVRCTFAEPRAKADVDATMQRQQQFVDSAIAQARAEGYATHVLHIDDDELLYCHRGMASLHQLLAATPPRAFDLHMHNLEAVHACAEAEDPFVSACAFRHQRTQYGAYSNGKSIGALAHAALHSNGVHHFANVANETVQVWSDPPLLRRAHPSCAVGHLVLAANAACSPSAAPHPLRHPCLCGCVSPRLLCARRSPHPWVSSYITSRPPTRAGSPSSRPLWSSTSVARWRRTAPGTSRPSSP